MRRRPNASIVGLVGLIVALGAAGGCARAKATTSPDVPARDMPAPPPRDVEPIESEPLPTSSQAAEPVRTPAPTRPRPAPTAPPRPEPQRPEPPRSDTPPPVTTDVKPEE